MPQKRARSAMTDADSTAPPNDCQGLLPGADPAASGALKAVFVALAVWTLTPWSSPPQALLLGMALGLVVGNPYCKESKKISGLLLRVCVVLLGFGMNLSTVLQAGVRGFAMAAVTIGTTFVVGTLLGRLLRVPSRTSLLITAGTAICGGSAIAAVGSVTAAEEGEMTVAIGTVFLLNAAALYTFPPLGHLLNLSQETFGTWAGIAIHDISSVVGAAASYGESALQTATAVKLSRALWIAPLTLAIARLYSSKKGGSHFPWFIVYFLLVSAVRTLIPSLAAFAPFVSGTAKAGLSLTLFLIGSGMSVTLLRTVGWRTLVQGVLLWLFISVTSLFFLMSGTL